MESKSEIILYKSSKDFQIDVKLQKEITMLSQNLIASLFEKDSDTINLRIKNIFNENELNEKSTTVYFSVVQKGRKGFSSEC